MKKNYNGSDVEYEEEKQSWLTRGRLILILFSLSVLIILIIILSVKNKEKLRKQYTKKDFQLLERRMSEEAVVYASQKNIELTDKKNKVNLKELLVENGGAIDFKVIKAAKICDGYVIFYRDVKKHFDSYIKCKDLYKTKGYEEKIEFTTTTKQDVDNEDPKIILMGEENMSLSVGELFSDPGFTATDNIDGDITSKVEVDGTVNTKKAGDYKLTYYVKDKAGNSTKVIRNITVTGSVITQSPTTTTIPKIQTTKPVVKTTTRNVQTTVTKTTETKITLKDPIIMLNGGSVENINVGTIYNEKGYNAIDSAGKNVNSLVNVSGTVDVNKPGTYTITYKLTDSYGKTAIKTRKIIVTQSQINVSSVSITPNAITIKIGSYYNLIASVSPSNASNKTVSWSSNNNSIVTVDQNGRIKANSVGVANITVKTVNGKTSSATVKVIK